MATEYISREYFRERLEKAKQTELHLSYDARKLKNMVAVGTHERHAGFCQQVIDLLDAIPAADVRPVKHGEWIVDDPGDYQLIECDQCHAQMWNHQSELPNYCYECGADMRKVVEIDQVKEGAE